MIKAGFARVDVTPPLGSYISGYYDPRYAKGVLDPLLATAVAFDNGKKKAVILAVDVIGIGQIAMEKIRPAIAEAAGIPREAVFVHCSHIHTGFGPVVGARIRPEDDFYNSEFLVWLTKRLCDVAVMAFDDVAPAKMLYTKGEVRDVAFVRRFRMKDGSVRTNPGWQNPDIDHALGTPDEESQLLILKREGKPEIGIVNFQVHTDVIGGEMLSADYPGFVRRTYEKNVDNSRCMYICGTQGDTNHVDVRQSFEKDCAHGYERSRYMGKKIAMSVLSNYELARELSGDEINFAEKIIRVKYNKGGSEEEVRKAQELIDLQKKVGTDEALKGVEPIMRRVELIAEASRIVRMTKMPDEKELVITALSVGNMALACFPGEPFTEVGRSVKRNSKFALTMTACCANGYEGYFPTEQAFSEGGYEVLTTSYARGSAERVIEASTEIVNAL
ncbi:MAG: hypothetical protein IKU65_00595 [Oscillospiraceae bacterium]|nr:hypothetical protein [Oscillospiraceae bacterium]